MTEMSLDSSIGPYVQFCLHEDLCHDGLKTERVAAKIYALLPRIGMFGCADAFVGGDVEFVAEGGIQGVEVECEISVCWIL